MNCGCTRYDFAYYQLTCLLSLFVIVRTQCIVVSNSYQIFLFHVYKLYYSRFLHLPCSNYCFSLIPTDHWWIYLPRFVSKRQTLYKYNSSSLKQKKIYFTQLSILHLTQVSENAHHMHCFIFLQHMDTSAHYSVPSMMSWNSFIFVFLIFGNRPTSEICMHCF